MNEDDILEEEDAASDRTLVAENEEEENPHPEYRMATITPSANTIPLADEVHEDEEATLADPTIMTLQTPLPEQPVVKQQNIHRLMEKIERQRQAAQNRTNQPTTLVTPTIKTPKKLIVSPGYAESGTSDDSSLTQQEVQDEQSSSNTTTAEIEERRIKLEFVSFFLFKILYFFFIFTDLENKHSKNKYVFYQNELISSHKIPHVPSVHHPPIFQLKVYLKIYVQQVIQLVFHPHHHHYMLVNNKKMIMNNLLKLFKQ